MNLDGLGRADDEDRDEDLRSAAPASKVYEALIRQAGYRGWFNAAGEVPEVVGGEAKLHFAKEGKPVDMRSESTR